LTLECVLGLKIGNRRPSSPVQCGRLLMVVDECPLNCVLMLFLILILYMLVGLFKLLFMFVTQIEHTITVAFAAWKAVKFGIDLGMQNIMLEGDHDVRREEQSWSRYGNLIDVFKTLQNSFQSWHVNHVKMEANMTAHCLAKAALQQSL